MNYRFFIGMICFLNISPIHYVLAMEDLSSDEETVLGNSNNQLKVPINRSTINPPRLNYEIMVFDKNTNVINEINLGALTTGFINSQKDIVYKANPLPAFLYQTKKEFVERENP